MADHPNIWAKLVEDIPLKDKILRELALFNKLRIELTAQQEKTELLEQRVRNLECRAPSTTSIDFENRVNSLPSDKTNPEYSEQWNALKVEISAYAKQKHQIDEATAEFKAARRTTKTLAIRHFEQERLIGMLLQLGQTEEIDITKEELDAYMAQ